MLKGVLRVKAAIKELTEKKERQLADAWSDTMTNIILGTPQDTGQARHNWHYTIDRPSNKLLSFGKRTDLSMPDTPKVSKRFFGKSHFLTNNLVYVPMLEYGGYPFPDSEKLVGGFSSLAPKGWVRQQVKILQRKVKAI